MDPQEVKDRIRNVIVGLVKAGNPDSPEAAEAAETAKSEFHDILAAKMRSRINPPAEVTPDDAKLDGETEVEVEEENQPTE